MRLFCLAAIPLIGVLGACSEPTQDSPASVEPPTSAEAALTRQCSAKVPLPAKGAVQGIDVSRHQGSIDWDAVVAHTPLEFAVARVSDGLTVIDGDVFTHNYAEIKRVGLRRGAYQFLRPKEDAAAQAKLFIDTLNAAGGYTRGDIPPTVDIEISAGTTPEHVQTSVRTWLELVQDAFGVRPMIYSLAGVSDYLGGCFTDMPLFIANFYQHCPKMPNAWAQQALPWAFFQYVDNSHIRGIKGTVDRDVFNGSPSEFAAFLDAAVDAGTTPIKLQRFSCAIY